MEAQDGKGKKEDGLVTSRSDWAGGSLRGKESDGVSARMSLPNRFEKKGERLVGR